MTEHTTEKHFALEYLESNRQRFSDFDMEIWRYAEPAWREYRSARAYRELLAAEGFAVEEGSGGMPTAFAATWGEGAPVLGSFSEYDAVPGHSQQATPRQAPREGFHAWAPGHTCPHSMLGTTCLAGILATKAVMQKFGIAGRLKLFGEPAEKMCASKPVHAAKGYFDDCDAFVIYHPQSVNTVLLDVQWGSYWSCVFTFETPAPETWIDPSLLPNRSPHWIARCPGALDALCLMYTSTKYTKEAMFPHTGTWSLNEFVLVGGDATSDNMSPRFSQIQYSWRSPDLAIQKQIYKVLETNAKQVAGMTGCTVSVRWVTKTRTGIPNHTLTHLAYSNMKALGPPAFGEIARRFGNDILENLGLPRRDNPFVEDNERLIEPEDYDKRLRYAMPQWQKTYIADDYVEYTWHAPTTRVFTARGRLKPPHASHEFPAWVDDAITGVPECIDPGLFLGAQIIAWTMIDLLTKPGILAQARKEFAERTGGGIGGTDWVAPLLARDFAPPHDLRWPEYIQTVRGEEWWIPNAAFNAGKGESIT
ncbi:MAG: amidohydrolase [Xanthobacteraceae bacterium]|nr:amidohydrolase [Xanthobacteraceae bacterium]